MTSGPNGSNSGLFDEVSAGISVAAISSTRSVDVLWSGLRVSGWIPGIWDWVSGFDYSDKGDFLRGKVFELASSKRTCPITKLVPGRSRTESVRGF